MSNPDDSDDAETETGGSGLGLGYETRVIVTFIAVQVLEDSEDLDLFEQDRFWVVAGFPVPLESLPREFILRIVSTLFANADYYHIRTLHRIAMELLLRSMEGHTDPDLPVVRAAKLIMDSEPVEWLNATPLMCKLVRLLDR